VKEKLFKTNTIRREMLYKNTMQEKLYN